LSVFELQKVSISALIFNLLLIATLREHYPLKFVLEATNELSKFSQLQFLLFKCYATYYIYVTYFI